MNQAASTGFTFGSVAMAALAFACSSSGGSGGGPGDASAAGGGCHFAIVASTADQAGPGGIPTVGIVNWSVDKTDMTAASIEFGLPGGPNLVAPVDVATGPNFRTLLLGMKGGKTYSLRIRATGASGSCTSADQSMTTGPIPDALPHITRTAGPAVGSQDRGFIISSTGLDNAATGATSLGGAPGFVPGMGGVPGFGGGPGFGGAPGDLPDGGMPGGGGTSYAFIFDGDGDLVWWTEAPASCSRAKMSFDGQYMWMVNLNVGNYADGGGEVARVSMDGLTRTRMIPGLSNCHHDLTILPDGRVACLSWAQQSGDQPSDLLEGDAQGNVTKIATLDANVYAGGTGGPLGAASYHANSIHYHQSDDSYTFGDRSSSVFLKISRAGQPLWQFGGDCAAAKVSRCVAGDWKVNHGHDLLDDGTFLFFNNGQSGPSRALFYQLTESGTFTATLTGMYSPGVASGVLGDVQRLPNGNTLVTFSTSSRMDEIDPSGALVQSVSGASGYAEWRATLYGPPPRF